MFDLAEMKKWLEARVVQDGDCLIWQLSLNYQQPQARYKGLTINVRRVLYELKSGKAAPKNWGVVCTCDTKGCVNPDHLKPMRRSKILGGRPKTHAERMKLSLAARARSRLTEQDVADIRFGPDSINAKAEKYNIPRRYVWDLIHGKYWKDYSSPFSGLMA